MASLLPANAGLFEKSSEAAFSVRWDALSAGADAVRTAKVNPPPSVLPYLVYEYGLGELTPYIPNAYELVVGRRGIDWQRIRGTPASVYQGLGWLGYTATLEDAWHGRAYWNSTQLRFGSLPLNDFPDLERIEGVTRLSLPKRSQLRRGVYQYDVTAAEADSTRLDECMLDFESGISVTPAGTLWSFGRVTEIEHALSQIEGTAIGNWIDEPEEEGLKWVLMQYPWLTATFPWADTPTNQRRILMAAWFVNRTLYVTFRDEDGEVIGHRRCRAVRPVNKRALGRYSVGDQNYDAVTDGRMVYIDAMTDFGDAEDVVAASVEITVGASRAPGVKPGKLWLEPDELVGGHAIALKEVEIPLRRTVRDHIKFVLDFDSKNLPTLSFHRTQNSQYLPLLAEVMELVPTPKLSFNTVANIQLLPLLGDDS
ncbi:Phage protein [Pseudorhizobium banfieldiae]|uniref:Phage protein n=1 Tax=Pseudorhizobium banfieldiae TaxID=1125847 RepID=L0NEF0_9HYPH|nr:phage tail protein [Pseudorhizobium banfieldiae]CAD6606244.1 phage protein [arsenite-oxidising bacterium NT-25]CCF19166.1 Phage protein [Pseudorhizobium banfieldiae]